MNGLVSSKPSQHSVRLALGGFLLLLIQNVLLLMGSGLDAHARGLLWVLTPVAALALLAALVGFPDPAPTDWRRRHGR